MSYAELNLDQGTTFETTLDLTHDDGTAINVAGYVFSSQIRKSYYSTNATATLTVSTIDVANGKIRLSLSAAETANVRPGRYLYDFKMTNTEAVTTRVIEGIITVTPQVTR